MWKTVLWAGAAVLGLAGGLFAYEFAFAADGRADCPGKIVCPLTGEEICKDKCPVVDAGRSDCPGTIECPLTGELVCSDQCPVVASSATPEKAAACCQEGR